MRTPPSPGIFRYKSINVWCENDKSTTSQPEEEREAARHLSIMAGEAPAARSTSAIRCGRAGFSVRGRGGGGGASAWGGALGASAPAENTPHRIPTGLGLGFVLE